VNVVDSSGMDPNGSLRALREAAHHASEVGPATTAN
jgi:hypothetical protein